MLLAESFAILEHEVPDAYEMMCDRLDGYRVGIRVDDEQFVAEFADGRARVLQNVESSYVQIATSRAAILAVLDGEVSLLNSVLGDEVQAKASLDDLITVNSGLAMYVKGAVRCPSFPALVERLRGANDPDGDK